MEYRVHKDGGIATGRSGSNPYGTKRLVGVSAILYDERMAEAFVEGVEKGGGKHWPKLGPLNHGERAMIRRLVAEQVTYNFVQGLRAKGLW